MFALKATSVVRASEFLHKRPEKGVTLRVQWVFRIAGHKAADMGAPAAILNPDASQFTQSAVMEYMLARTVLQDILLAGYLRGKQRRGINPCTVNGAVESDGTINRLQQFHVSALSLPTSQILLRYPSPFNVICGILSGYTIDDGASNSNWGRPNVILQPGRWQGFVPKVHTSRPTC